MRRNYIHSLHKCDVDYSSPPKSWNLVGVAQKKPKKKWSRPKINFFSSSRKAAGEEKVLYALWWAKIERSFCNICERGKPQDVHINSCTHHILKKSFHAKLLQLTHALTNLKSTPLYIGKGVCATWIDSHEFRKSDS